MKDANNWHLYILRCGDGSLYTGIAKDLERRLAEHQAQGNRCAKYLRGRLPLNLVWHCEAPGRAEASRLENYVKALSKAQKEILVQGQTPLEALVELA